ncbi:MAG: protein-glutamate O-methyltransferase CheR [Spirochaetes bacterium]|nr:protein-glutamate O-methyltransferase CheR [Spirochaetota bacterium]
MIDFENIVRLTDSEFEKFAKLVYNESGIFLKTTKLTLLSNRLRKRLNALNLKTFTEYYDYINSLADRSKEIESLIDVVSTNETYFFRNEKQFESLTGECFPEISKRKQTDKRLRIWSAGCSTGEEPYTIGICILEAGSLFQGWDIEIIATDIAYSVLDFAKKGEYSGRRIDKVKPELLKKYFLKSDSEQYTIKDEVKKIINFKLLNLFKDSYPVNIDIIFCRNVMIYFDKEHQKKLLSGFYRSIQNNGYLFLGHSETIHSISDDFTYRKIIDSPVYIPKDK